MKVLVISNSQTGNTDTFVEFLEDIRNKFSLELKILSLQETISIFDNLSTENKKSFFDSFDSIMIGTYTWGNGVVPKDMRRFILDNKKNIPKSRVLLFGSGITIYKFFCGALDKIERMIFPREDDIPKVKFELTFIPEENPDGLKELFSYINKIKEEMF